MSDLMELTWNNPMGISLWSIEGVPIKVTGMNPMRMSLSKWMESMRNEWNEVNRGEMSEWMELTWNNPMGKVLWSVESVPIKVTWCEWFDQTLSKWSDSMRNEWIEVNRVKWSEMSDLKDLTWNPFKVTWVNSVGISLWVENECPYGSDLMLVIWPNPIKMNGIDEKWMNWGE